MTSLHSAYALALVLALACFVTPSTCNFNLLAQSTFGGDRVKITEGGRGLSLGLDKTTGSGFQSKNEYLFGRFDMQLKLVPGDSAGTVTTFYLSSPQNGGHDEIDFEFLGNVSGQPYTMHTNVYSQGKGNKEMQFHLWFDPTTAFHTYSVIWNPNRIVFLVDNSPIRVFVNHAAHGVPFPTNLPMRVYCSLWNADEWATQGGRVKTDWTKAPFFANYRNFNINACAPGVAGNACRSQAAPNTWKTYELDAQGRNRLRWIQSKFRVYDYCRDSTRFPGGPSHECKDAQY